MKRCLILLVLLGLDVQSFAQPIKNGKFYCKIDTSQKDWMEEWTLKLMEVNVVDLESIKTDYYSKGRHIQPCDSKEHIPNKRNSRKVKVQFYTGYWKQNGDTIKVGLDFKGDIEKQDYDLIFVKNGNSLILLKTTPIINKYYSDEFYGKSVWIKQKFKQAKNTKYLRALF